MENTAVAKKRRIKWWHILLIILLALSVVITSAIAWAISYAKKNFNYSYNDITSSPEDLGFTEVKNDEIVNIALFGIDTKTVGSFEGRSDSIIILSINKTSKQIKLISVMRDSFVPIEYDGEIKYTKINAAYENGGPELAIKTLNKLFDLDISEYATVNFYGMADIIDAVGGVEVEVLEDEIKYINGGVQDYCNHSKKSSKGLFVKKAGVQVLNGIQAVAYSRIRVVSNAEGVKNDYGRTDRQRFILEQLFNKALKMQTSQYIDLIKALSPCCETSLSYGEIMDLALDVLLYSPTFGQSRVPFQSYTMADPIGTGEVVYYDTDFATKLIHEFIYNDIKPEDYIESNGIEQNDWYAAIKNKD